MVIIGNINGQLANQLFIFSHFAANAVEYGYELHNPIFNEHAVHFKSGFNMFEGKPIFVKYRFNIPARWVNKLNQIAKKVVKKSRFHIYYSLGNEQGFDLNDSTFLKDARTKIVITDGWLFRDYRNLTKHATFIRRMFAPNRIYQDRVDQLTQTIRRPNIVLIGVHIRRGDYSKWQGGKYFFDDGVYLKKMLALRSVMKSAGKEALFLLCSNERIDKSHFRVVDVVDGVGGRIEDLYSLSKCDYIIGPPSSYSMWASFYGRVPLFHIESRDSDPLLGSFSICPG